MALRRLSLPSTGASRTRSCRPAGSGPLRVVAQAASRAGGPGARNSVRACSVLPPPAATEQPAGGFFAPDMETATLDWLDDYMSNITQSPRLRELNFRPTKPTSASRTSAAAAARLEGRRTTDTTAPSSGRSAVRTSPPQPGSVVRVQAGRPTATTDRPTVSTEATTSSMTDPVSRRQVPSVQTLPRTALRAARLRSRASRKAVALPSLQAEAEPQTTGAQFLADMSRLVGSTRLGPQDQARCCEMLQAAGPEASDNEASVKDLRKARQLAEALLIAANLGTINNLALKYTNDHVSFDDLVSAGLMYLRTAAANFDVASNKSRFGTYLYSCVRPIMANMAYRRATVLDFPERVHHAMRKVAKARGELYSGSRINPTVEDIASATSLTPAKVQQAMQAEKLSSVSIEDTDWDGPSYSRLVPADVDDNGVLTHREIGELRDMIESILSELTERERDIVVMRYGLGEGEETGLSAAATAKALGVSRSGCHKAEARALQKMKERAADLLPFAEAMYA